MRGRRFLGTMVAGLVVLCPHGQTSGDQPKPGVNGRPVLGGRAVPKELEALKLPTLPSVEDEFLKLAGEKGK